MLLLLLAALALLWPWPGRAKENRSPGATPKPEPLNILFFLADDCEWDSAGAFGCPIADITPHIDRLASEGMRFMHAYSTVAVCTPVRATMMTGLYPHHSGCEGFEPIRREVTTVNERLHKAGYSISLFGKNGAYAPHDKYCVDLEWQSDLGNRNPAKVHEFVQNSIAKAREQGKPFFCHVNCADPHRPFFGSAEEAAAMAKFPERFGKPSRIITEAEVPVPKFLDDLPDVRKELAQYFNCVKRLDDSVGAALKALEESGQAGNTLVVFYGGDHGMSFPFSKSNAYLQSNHGGLVIRWPGVAKPGTTESDHMISTVDFTPTWLEAAGLDPDPNLDGRSFLSILKGEKQAGRDTVYCYYYRTAGELVCPMRAIRTKTDAYIWNPWSDGVARYQAENMSGLSWKAMLQSAKTDPQLRRRCDYYLYRMAEEYFLDASDPGERNNLIANVRAQERIKELAGQLQLHLQQTGDPLSAYFARRHDLAAMGQLRAQLAADAKGFKEAKNKKKKRAVRDPDEAP